MNVWTGPSASLTARAMLVVFMANSTTDRIPNCNRFWWDQVKEWD